MYKLRGTAPEAVPAWAQFFKLHTRKNASLVTILNMLEPDYHDKYM